MVVKKNGPKGSQKTMSGLPGPMDNQRDTREKEE